MSTVIILTPPPPPPPPRDPKLADPDGFAQQVRLVGSDDAGEEAKRMIDDAVAAGWTVRVVRADE